MISLNDGRSELFQWDTARKLTVDAGCSQVHFSNKVYGNSIDVAIIDGVADIPDILLQSDRDLHVWAYIGTPEDGYTKIAKTFKVNRRNKPAGYIYTPPEKPATTAISWNDLEDKPFYDTRETITTTINVDIEWDGNTAGKVSDSGGRYYKVSDLVFSNEDARKMIFTTTDGRIDLSSVGSHWSGDNWFGNGEQGLLIIRKAGEYDGFSGTYFPATFMEAGVYFRGDGRSLTGNIESTQVVGELKPIESKYIPETSQPVSWDDVTDKPFGEEVLFSGNADFVDPIPGIQVACAEIQLAPYDLEEGDEITITYSDTGYSMSDALKKTYDGLYTTDFHYNFKTGVATLNGDYYEETHTVEIKRTTVATQRLNFDSMPKSQILQMVLSVIQPAEEESS